MVEEKRARLYELLHRYWGYTAFRSGQLEAIESVTDGYDTLVLMPTGGGKSITFQVSGLYLGGTTVVVSPLIALMEDQIGTLRRCGIRAVAIHSGLSEEDQALSVNNAYSGQCAFIYVSPERLATECFQRLACSINIGLLVVDEAHCISQWGHDFRPEYRMIAEFRQVLLGVPCMAVTATATPGTAEDIMTQLAFRKGRCYRNSFARPNLRYTVRATFAKNDKLIDILLKVSGAAIVYCRNRAMCDTYADFLRVRGMTATSYHAGLSSADRKARQEAWLRGEIRVMVATNAFGMGIDKPDVRVVVHLDPPESLEEYYQEAGRAGRDGAPSYAVLLYDSGDLDRLEQTFRGGVVSRKAVERAYESLLDYLKVVPGSWPEGQLVFSMGEFCKQQKILRKEALRAFGVLETQGLLSVAPRDASRIEVQIVVQPCVAEQMLAAGSKEWRVVATLMEYYPEIGDAMQSLSLPSLARAARLSQVDYLEVLNKLVGMGFARASREVGSAAVRLMRPRFEKGHFTLDVGKLEALNSLARSHAEGMLNYMTETQSCRSQLLCAYFGEMDAAPCGVCATCTDRALRGKRELERRRQREQIEMALRRGPMRLEELVSSYIDQEPRFEETLQAMLEEGRVEKKRGGWLRLREE